MAKIYRNGTLHCIIDDAGKAAEALQALRDCYPDDIWIVETEGKRGMDENAA